MQALYLSVNQTGPILLDMGKVIPLGLQSPFSRRCERKLVNVEGFPEGNKPVEMYHTKFTGKKKKPLMYLPQKNSDNKALILAKCRMPYEDINFLQRSFQETTAELVRMYVEGENIRPMDCGFVRSMTYTNYVKIKFLFVISGSAKVTLVDVDKVGKVQKKVKRIYSIEYDPDYEDVMIN